MRYKWLYFILSACIIIPGLYSLFTHGLQPSIDFTGGTLVEIEFVDDHIPGLEALTATISGLIEISSIQSAGPNGYVIRTKPMDQSTKVAFNRHIASLSASLHASPSAATFSERRFETVGPTLGQELMNKTITSVVLASLAILLYIAYRFKEFKFGITAVIAMFHDTFILLGIFSILGAYHLVEVDTLFVTAVLTTLSFSVHDTIVVYDRIRESLKKLPQASFTDIVNKSVGETLARSINNSMTIIFMLLALYLMGGESIKWFVFALLIGTIAGTYSSTFTAAPLLIVWESLFNRKKRFK